MSLANTFIQGSATILKLGGSQGVLTKTIIGPYNPVTGQSQQLVTTHPVQVSNPSHVERWENGSLVRQAEDSLIIGSKGLTVVPDTGDLITIGQVTWTLTSVKAVEAQNVTIYYQGTVKK